jgi:hypothetical protein
MGPGGGEYRLCLPPLTLLGGWIWTALVRPRLGPRLRRALDAAGCLLRPLGEKVIRLAKKISESAKKGLQ